MASAKDNGAIFAIAQGQRSEVAGYGVVQQSLDRTISTTDTALAAGEAISDLLIELKERALAAKDEGLTTEQRAAFQADFTALRNQIGTIVANAEFNGVNLINGSQTGDISALANSDGSQTITVADENLSLSGSIVTLTTTATVANLTGASAAITVIETSINNVSQALARLGTASKSLEIHSEFVTKLSDNLEAGIGNLVDADLARESAKLQALQDQAAAWRAGSVDREPVDRDRALLLPLRRDAAAIP